MAKEPNSKLDNIHDNISAEMLRAGIINENGDILNQSAFVKFINDRKQKLLPLIEATEKDGVVIDQYENNLLYSELDYLDNMLKQNTTKPANGSAYPAKDDLEKYFSKQQEKKQENVKRVGFFRRFFGRNK